MLGNWVFFWGRQFLVCKSQQMTIRDTIGLSTDSQIKTKHCQLQATYFRYCSHVDIWYILKGQKEALLVLIFSFYITFVNGHNGQDIGTQIQSQYYLQLSFCCRFQICPRQYTIFNSLGSRRPQHKKISTSSASNRASRGGTICTCVHIYVYISLSCWVGSHMGPYKMQKFKRQINTKNGSKMEI